MTEGRKTRPPSAVSIALVTRSGIDASRLSPRDLSFMKPETIGRAERSSRQKASNWSSPDHPCADMRLRSASNLWAGKTSETDTSCSPGAEMKD
eukprot:scaffold24744_cov103-Isochrysis_galbana.AAC.3